MPNLRIFGGRGSESALVLRNGLRFRSVSAFPYTERSGPNQAGASFQARKAWPPKAPDRAELVAAGSPRARLAQRRRLGGHEDWRSQEGEDLGDWRSLW